MSKTEMSDNWRDLAKSISKLENGDKAAIVSALRLPLDNPHCQIIGVTGPPGSGKSTLCNQIIESLAKNNCVAAILVDPSSPYSGGSILGDRIRLQALTANPNVFIRSLSNRGNAGGLNRTIVSVVRLLFQARFDYVLIETVGAGQSEIKIASIADTTIVVAMPNLGDEIQAIKSGIMEIADVFAVNKADLDGADIMFRDILASVRSPRQGWAVPVLKTIAKTGDGVEELLSALENHHQYLLKTPEELRKQRLSAAAFELEELFTWMLSQKFKSSISPELVDSFLTGAVDLETLIDDLLKCMLRKGVD